MPEKLIKADFQYVTSYISKLTFSNSFITYRDSQEVEKGISIDYKIKSIDKNDDGFFGLSIISIVIEISKDEKDMNIELEMEGLFTGDKSIDEKTFKQMLKINGYATLYANVRSYLISLTSQSFNGDKVVIPHINLLHMLKENNNEKKSEEDE